MATGRVLGRRLGEAAGERAEEVHRSRAGRGACKIGPHWRRDVRTLLPGSARRCGRHFGRRGQGHECAPAMSLDEYFATGPPYERPVVRRGDRPSRSVGPVHVEPVSVGIFLEARARRSPSCDRCGVGSRSRSHCNGSSHHPLIVRRPIRNHGGRFWHVVNLSSADDFDDDLRTLLTEAYLDVPE